MAPTELQKLFTKYKITAKKYMGDDAGSWAVFREGQPAFTGLTRSEVNYYKKVVLEIARKEETKNGLKQLGYTSNRS